MLYTILGYESEDCLENEDYTVLEENVDSEKYAIKLANSHFVEEIYPIIKIESADGGKEFTQVLRVGLNEFIQKHDMSKSAIDEWIEGGEVIKIFDNKSNLCLLVKFQHGDKDENPHYQYQRFFNMGGQTVCSVDKEFYETDCKKVKNAAAILLGTETNTKFNY